MTTYGIDANALLRANPTGVEKYVASVLAAMMAQPLKPGEQVTLYAAQPQPSTVMLPMGWSWKMLGFPFPKGWTHGRLSLELLMHPPTVFWNPAHEIPLLHRKAKIATTVHDVAYVHIPEAYVPADLSRQKWAIQRAVKADCILAVSETTKQDLVHAYHVPPEKVVATPLAPALPASPSVAETVLTRYQLHAGQYFLFVGRLEAKKNVLTLVRAFLHLKEQFGIGHPLTLALAGTRGYKAQELDLLLAQSPHGKDVRLLGYVPDADLPALLQSSRGFVFPTLGEGFGLPVLEAMQHGAAVIASDLPVMREVAGEAAIFVAPQDAGGWTRAMKQLLEDDALRADYLARGQRQVSNFSWAATAGKTWEALRGLVV